VGVAPTPTATVAVASQSSPTVISPPYCADGETPGFHVGFATIKDQLGDIMGRPTEWEHAQADTGDVQQQTTTGLTFYRRSINIVTFTDGFQHWAITPDGLLTWTETSIDPPPDLTPVQSSSKSFA
jgi:hypothetical protein